MALSPNFDTFAPVYRDGRPQAVWTKLVADLETPVSAMLKLAGGRPNSFLLESVEGGETRGRYSVIGLKPDLIWRCHGDRPEINRKAASQADAFEPEGEGALASLRALLVESHIDLPEELPPMAAGLVGYMGYETVHLMERLPLTNTDVLGLPDGLFLRPTVMAIFDSVEDTLWVVSPVRPQAGIDAAAAYQIAGERLANVAADFQRDLPLTRQSGDGTATAAEPASNMSRDDYHRIVRAAKDYIGAGDIFQVVLSQRFSVPFALPPFALYRALRRLNPSPFLFFLDFGGFAVVGSSPEILVRLRDGTVTIRPIAGTRKRGANRAEDRTLAEDLSGDPKELAEHLMLLDLGRNDVGRVARIGTVAVTEQMMVEYYSHVMHLVSNVEGSIRPEFDAMDALAAGFPAGTVSGAPKVRAMEIIDELERDRRSIYAGCVGYFAANGTMDTCIALRTAVVKDGVMHVQAGGGIVADSDPEAEYQESRNKARALLRAAEEAHTFAAAAAG
ncbi:MAG: anthranilate synthase component I [Alphaproteobacteria bacterium]|jgi:anthranilate synthase component 1|nr:anthranilate synthase component I [Alphaproteobacteria bacterium]MDP6515542.1 anthranilate synthase component I [Alphaproteobacteria bacterium]|tara:strand:+ start:100 stop:1611 length:1512 start_codon:yes stop_codon:yes gene_type:complete